MGKDLKETIASKFPSWTAKFKDFIDEVQLMLRSSKSTA